MGKCIVCGKSGIFTIVDAKGRCKECARQEDESEYRKFYSNLLSEFLDIMSYINLGNDAIEALKLIPSIEEKRERCKKFNQILLNSEYRKRLGKELANKVTYRDSFSKKHGFGYIDEWELSLHSDSGYISPEFIISKLTDEMDSYSNGFKNKIKRIQECAEYQERLCSIPSFSIDLSDTEHKQLKQSELENLIKYSNITAKTDFNKLGNFVVIDTETTGLSCSKNDIVEIAAIKFENWVPIEKFYSLINPKKHIPDDATEVNGITDEMVSNSPEYSQIIDSLNNFVGDMNIVGHNLPFDLKFIYHGGFDFTIKKRKYFDTLELSQKVLKKPKMKWDKEFEEYVRNDDYDYDVEDYKLTTLCDYYNLRDNLIAHRALSDAYATGLLFQKLAEEKCNL